MLVLLPPSETKSVPRRGRPLDLDRVSFPQLATARTSVLDAVALASAGDDAHSVLGVPASLSAEIARNLGLREAPTAPAGEIYQGVLYDALDLGSLDPASRRRATGRLVVVSALFGALRLTDRIPAYRLSMAVSLPGPGPLARFWRQHVGAPLADAAGSGLIIDARSSTYAAAWTPPVDLARRWVHIRVPGATHMAKHTRGLVARELCRVAHAPRTPGALADALASSFEVSLDEPGRAGKPWILDVSAS